jgi:hypothetical protein
MIRLVFAILMLSLVIPAVAYGNSAELAAIKIPPSACNEDFGSEEPAGTLFLGSGTLTLQNGSGDVHFSCLLAIPEVQSLAYVYITWIATLPLRALT